MKKLFAPLLATCLCLAAPALAAEELVPTNITADTMTYNADKNAVVFEKDVHVTREGFELWADRITVLIKSKKGESKAEAASKDALAAMQGGDLDRIIAEKNVRFKYNQQTGEAQKATYDASKALLTMEGNPVLRDGDNSLRGNIIKYYVNENRSEVVGGPSRRVEAVFSTSDTKKKGK